MENVKPVTLAYDAYEPISPYKPSNAPIVMIHGIGHSRRSWDNLPQIIANGSKRKVFALDARNHGDSEWSDDFTFKHMAIDLEHFLDTLEIPKAIIIGHSMGGRIAITFAFKKPERVEKLILEDISLRDAPPIVAAILLRNITILRDSLARIPQGTDEMEARKLAADSIHKHLPQDPASDVIRRKEASNLPIKKTKDGRYAWKSNLNAIERSVRNGSLLAKDFHEECSIEALFIHGLSSIAFMSNDKDVILKYFSKATFHAIDGAAHNVHGDKPEEFTEQVLKFVSQ